MSTNINYYHCDEVLRKEFFANKWIKSTHNNELRVVSIIGGSVYKGLETIIDCFNLIKTHTNIEISWHVIGLSNSDELVKICKNKYKKIDFKNIILHGKKTANQIVDILRNSDIYVHPSHIENSSNAISEAMTFGIPVIATFTGGTNTLIEDNQTGILVQDGEPLSLASAIIDLNSNAEKAKIMGAMARETALKRHNPQEITNILVKIYKDIMSDSHYSTSQTPNT